MGMISQMRNTDKIEDELHSHVSELIPHEKGCNYENEPCSCGVSEDLGRVILLYREAIGLTKIQTEMAFGGCHKCYGKGYSTYRHGISGAPDFEGDRGFETAMKTHMVFCTCDRGKQLSELLTKKE